MLINFYFELYYIKEILQRFLNAVGILANLQRSAFFTAIGGATRKAHGHKIGTSP